MAIELPYRLANIKDIPNGKAIAISLPDGEKIALFNIAGTIHALTNTCPHMGGPLSEGEIDDGHVTCPWHGMQFDLKNGACLNGQGEDCRAYKITVKDGDIFLIG